MMPAQRSQFPDSFFDREIRTHHLVLPCRPTILMLHFIRHAELLAFNAVVGVPDGRREGKATL